MLAVRESSREEPHFVIVLSPAEVVIQTRGIQLKNLDVILDRSVELLHYPVGKPTIRVVSGTLRIVKYLSVLIIRPTAQVLIAKPTGTGWHHRRSLEAVSPAAISLLVEMDSLLLIAGNPSLLPRKDRGISDLIRFEKSQIGEIPCIFPAKQGSVPRDEFAPDSPHRHSVCHSREFEVGARGVREIPAIPRGFGRGRSRTRSGDGRVARPMAPSPSIFSAGDSGGSE